MDSSIIETTYILLFICIIQGLLGLTIHYHESHTAVEGQNISLPCIVEEQDMISNKINIIQMEWIKQQQGVDKKMAVFHPNYPIQYYKNATVVEGKNTSTGQLQGSLLKLFKVTVNDSGNYICEITSYPYGSIRKISKVKITGAPLSLKMFIPYEFVKEGDEVKIRCAASPPPLRYKLQRSKDESFLLESLNGEFILPNVTRNNSDLYVCFPLWDSLGQHQGFNSTMELTVNYLESSECNTSSPLKVTIGEDVAISCKTEASQPLLYKWMKDNTTVSSSDTLSLSSVTSNQSGTYKLIAAFHNNHLWTGMEFSIHVLPEKSRGFTTEMTSTPVRSVHTLYSFLSQTTEPQSNFTSVETSSLPTTRTTSESSYFLTSTAQPNATMTTEALGHTIHDSLFNDNSTASPAGNASTLHPDFVNPSNTSFSSNLSTTTVSTTGSKHVTFIVTSKSTTNYTLTGTTMITKKASNRATFAVIVIPILLLLLIVIVLLYKIHLTKKKMNLPPPFKPPPPPVKYTSVRNHDVPMTDILV